MCQQELTACTLRACWFEKGYKLSDRHPSKLTLLIPFCFLYPFIFAGRFNVCVMSTDFYRKDGCNWIKWKEGKKRKEYGYDWVFFDSHLPTPTFIPSYRLLGALLHPPSPSLRNHFHAKKNVSSSYLFLCMGSYHRSKAAITFPLHSSVMFRYKGGSFFYIIFSFKHLPLAGKLNGVSMFYRRKSHNCEADKGKSDRGWICPEGY